MTDNFNKQLLLMKKEKFVEVVIKICKERNLPIPEINFDGCSEENNELAHYHPDENKICCSERQLHMQNFDDIFDTASHEVAHILELNHDSKFIKQKILNDKAGWMFPAGVTVIDNNNDNQSLSDYEKEQNLKILEDEICQKEEQNILKEFPLAPRSTNDHIPTPREIKEKETMEYFGHILTSKEIIKLSGEHYPIENPGEPPENDNIKKVQLKQKEIKNYVQLEKKEIINNEIINKQNTSLIKETNRKGIIVRIKCFFGYHNWQKIGGLHNAGKGKFSQIFICKSCKKTKKVIG